MKRLPFLFLAPLLIIAITGCSNENVVSKEQYDAAIKTIDELTAKNEMLQSQLDELKDEYQKILSQNDISQKETDVAESTVDTNEKSESDSPWSAPLPDGIAADIQISEDKMTMYIVYSNNTEDAVSIGTSYIFGDDDLNPFMEGSSVGMYVAAGCKYIEVLDAWDPIGSYGLECQVNRVYQAVRDANEALSIESYKNSDGSVSATFNSTEGGASLDGSVFYFDEDGTILGYQSFGMGGIMPFDETFYAPEYDYADYFIFCEAIV